MMAGSSNDNANDDGVDNLMYNFVLSSYSRAKRRHNILQYRLMSYGILTFLKHKRTLFISTPNHPNLKHAIQSYSIEAQRKDRTNQ